ncbi:MAG: hypothetical protein WEC84_01990 [Candidatus Andersenbacteria bacterium]
MSQYPLRDELVPALNVLRQLGGSITFQDDTGEEYVIMRSTDVSQDRETQLTLPSADAVSEAIRRNVDDIEEDVIERINRDIAMSVEGEDEALDDLSLEGEQEEEAIFNGPTPPSPVRVRFEPLKGDLSPDLQD